MKEVEFLGLGQGRPQDQIRFDGHAIEARLYAEDAYDGWKPRTGRVAGWRPERAKVRVDHGLTEGGEVTPYYDAMVAKVIAHGRDRADAVRRLTRALEQAPLFGPANNSRFLRDLVNHPRFTAARMTTTLLDNIALTLSMSLVKRATSSPVEVPVRKP